MNKKLAAALAIIATAITAGVIFRLPQDQQPAPPEQAPSYVIGSAELEKLQALSGNEFSGGDFTVGDLKDRNLNGLVVYNATFSRQELDSDIFPSDMKGVIFLCSRLDNVIIPKGTEEEPNRVFNTVGEGANATFWTPCGSRKMCLKPENDNEDWICDPATKNPLEPLNKKMYEELGLSQDPKDLPKVKFEKPITQMEPEQLKYIKEKQTKNEAILDVPSEASLETK